MKMPRARNGEDSSVFKREQVWSKALQALQLPSLLDDNEVFVWADERGNIDQKLWSVAEADGTRLGCRLGDVSALRVSRVLRSDC